MGSAMDKREKTRRRTEKAIGNGLFETDGTRLVLVLYARTGRSRCVLEPTFVSSLAITYCIDQKDEHGYVVIMAHPEHRNDKSLLGRRGSGLDYLAHHGETCTCFRQSSLEVPCSTCKFRETLTLPGDPCRRRA